MTLTSPGFASQKGNTAMLQNTITRLEQINH